MQKVSGMQRNRTYLYLIADTLFSAGVLFYLLLSAVYRGLPPLIGFFFTAMVVQKYENDVKFKKFGFSWFFSIFYLFCAEQIHGFNLFSVAIAYCIFYFVVYENSFKYIKFRNFLICFYVMISYVLVFVVSNTISAIKKSEYLPLSGEYLNYIVIEILLALLFFKGRLV